MSPLPIKRNKSSDKDIQEDPNHVTEGDNDSFSSVGSSSFSYNEKQEQEKEERKRKKPSLKGQSVEPPPLNVQWSELGINPEELISNTSRIHDVYNKAIREDNNPTSTEQPPLATSSPPLVDPSRSYHDDSNNDSIMEPDEKSENSDSDSLEKNRKEELLALIKLECEILGTNYENLEPEIKNYSLSKLHGFIEGMKYCLSNYHKRSFETINSLFEQVKKISLNQIEVNQEVKNLRTSIGTPTNVLKSIEQKIKDINIHPVVADLQQAQSMPAPSSTKNSIISMPSTSSVPSVALSARSVVVPPSGIMTPEEKADLMKKDVKTLLKRGLKEELAVLVSTILTNTNPKLSRFRIELMSKLESNYRLDKYNNDEKFIDSCQILSKYL